MYMPRRLWFEDATGKRQEVREDDLLRRPEPLVILGEPGMGKSRLLDQLARGAGVETVTARKLIRRPDPRPLLGDNRLIVVDALDEVAASGEGDAVDRVLQRLAQLEFPRFVLSCRVGDWRAATSVAAIRDEYSEPPLQLHLDPLEADEQERFLGEHVGSQRARKLLRHFRSFGLDFLGNPQTLELIAKLPADQLLPTTSTALFEQAITVMRQEHSNRRQELELPEQAALDAAGAAFAGLILSGSSALVRRASANLADGEIALPEVEALDDGNVERTIRTTGLFASVGHDGFTYWHRRVGEFLGARWLARQVDTPAKRERLLHLFHAQDLVPASLRGLHAWLARYPHFASRVIAADPMGVVEYGDADGLAPAQAWELLSSLTRLAERNPRFRDWQPVRAVALVSGSVATEAERLLADPSASFGLRLLIAEQVARSGYTERFVDTLHRLLLDPSDVFAIRRAAGDALLEAKGADWPILLEELRCQASEDSTRLAFELMQQLGIEFLSDEQVVATALAYDGLTLCALPPTDGRGISVLFWRFGDRVPAQRLDRLLDILTDYTRDLLPEHVGIEEIEVIDLAFDLIARRLDAGPVEPLRLWSWLQPYEEQHSYRRERKDLVQTWLREHDDIRREIQAHVILHDNEPNIRSRAFKLFWRSPGLAPTDDDIVALLGHFDPKDRSDDRWREVLELVPHEGEQGRASREAARVFVAHDPQMSAWLDRLAEPPLPEWKRKQDEKARQRAAKRALEHAEHRRHYQERVADVRAGEFGVILPLAQAYLKLFHDLGDGLAAHERVADWLGEEIAAVAHQGFEAFLTARSPRPTARQMAVSFARGRRWNAGPIIVAALAERVRTRDRPFDDLRDERLMAGVFELWHTHLHDHAKLPDLLPRLEAELRQRGAWETATRLYLIPQLKRRRDHVDRLYQLMRSDEDAVLATHLAAEWLSQCPDMPTQPETEMIDRLVLSRRRDELRTIGDARRARSLNEDQRRNWDAVQLLFDFDAARARLGEAIEPELLWHLRARAGGGLYDGRSLTSLSPQQLAWIIATFRRLWPVKRRPTGGSSGDVSPWDATDYINSVISRLGNNTSAEAFAALETLLEDLPDGYTEYLRIVIAEQRQKRVDAAYDPPTLAQISTVLDSGMPADAGDLQATMLYALNTVQAQLRGNDVDWYRGYFREDGRHKNEEPCRDELIKMLRAIDGRFEYAPERHVADDKRVDIFVRADGQSALPIEVKGQWHPELWTGADAQLDYLYLNDWRAERGIYLALWFGGNAKLAKVPTGVARPTTAAELEQALVATSKAARDGRVAIVVLDLTRPAPC